MTEVTNIPNALTQQEGIELAACEQVIERGLTTFYEVGKALLQIRDERLYRAEHATFEEYCRTRWKMSRSRAHRMIEAAGIADNLLPMGNIPTNERQIRPLARLLPEQQQRVWAEALSRSTNPTSRDVLEALAQMEATFGPDGPVKKAAKDFTEDVKAWREEAVANTKHNSLLFRFIEAIETFSDPPLPPKQAAREIAAMDTPDTNWEKRAWQAE